MQFAIEDIAWTSRRWIEGPISGVIVSFHGLGDPGLRNDIEWHELQWARLGGLTIFPYLGPWAWLTESRRAVVDELIDKVYEAFHLSNDVPLILTGGSLGGYNALLYARYSRRPISACAAVCPVTDMKASFHERPDVPRTILYAFQGRTEDLEGLFIEHSPLHQAAHMPRVPYFFSHGGKDVAVAKRLHSDPMVAALRELGHDVTYLEIPHSIHGELTEARQQRVEFISRFLKPRKSA